nr:hypothetical protein [Moritella viscosa]SHO15722.1 Uncharacterized protein MPN_042 [Moritella viscosa]
MTTNEIDTDLELVAYKIKTKINISVLSTKKVIVDDKETLELQIKDNINNIAFNATLNIETNEVELEDFNLNGLIDNCERQIKALIKVHLENEETKSKLEANRYRQDLKIDLIYSYKKLVIETIQLIKKEM